ncbi:uracil phosphoribosyltransferase [Mycoplasmopsis columbina]|uniref:Uracil phosphoribosyltransferase n=1 Tax=Mycoplasmopsis columbina SF7 TaxID=1037410 RepID=F9UK41_9BACT|nr:uracil phosphoribosyltransferase [Mycoplasmopsis columbina]EGV00046.1 uracil phosphoribosyltransferase [Mycoplasmopsis columbina SF7]VEU76942.1 uracil phosphoribosyltransferase [Mycoplasmopsis columbina]
MLKVIEHPLISVKLTNMRDENANHSIFRRNLNEIASLMVYEVLRNYQTKSKEVITPIGLKYKGYALDKEIVIVPILRAGLGMLEGLLELVPEARVGHIGLNRNEITHLPESYYYKMPNVAKDSYVFVVDPMLATGGSAADAIEKLHQDGFTNVQLVCLVGAPEGVKHVEERFGKDKIQIFLAALDERLNEHKYIEPGLGDAGDRIYGTK